MGKISDQEKKERLGAAGCHGSFDVKGGKIPCAHAQQAGDPNEQGKKGVADKGTRVYCARYFASNGELLPMFRKDPSHDNQPNLDHLYATELEGVAGASLVEQKKAELARVKAENEARAKAALEADEVARLDEQIRREQNAGRADAHT